MKQDRLFHILSFLHFSNKNEPGKKDEQYDRLWKMTTIFDKPNNAKYYNYTEDSEVDEIVPFRGRAVFKQYIPKKHKGFGIKVHKLCISKDAFRQRQGTFNCYNDCNLRNCETTEYNDLKLGT
jgi:hypothetical protein